MHILFSTEQSGKNILAQSIWDKIEQLDSPSGME